MELFGITISNDVMGIIAGAIGYALLVAVLIIEVYNIENGDFDVYS